MENNIVVKLESEKQLEDVLFDLLTKNFCENRGLRLPIDIQEKGKYAMFRQFEIDGYGIADIVLFYLNTAGFPCAHIIELKNVNVSSEDINQVMRYVKGLSACETFFHIDCSLIGLAPKSGHFIINELNHVLDFYSFSIDPRKGIVFHLANEFVKKVSNTEKIKQKVIDVLSSLRNNETHELNPIL